MDGDDEDFVFYGTPIQAEDDVSSRKKKSVAEAAGQLRTLPSWKQEVRDEEGRRRFHGAFTGGYSAGYYNTVGSKEGWTPSTFTSSRKNRAELKQQSIANFLDEDEKTEMEDRSLGTSMQFDTFGFTAVELARKQADKEHQQRPSAIPGPVPDEMVAPVTESIGVKLLLKMGWRRGRSIKESQTTSLYDKRREARKAFLALAPDTKEQTGGPELEEVDNGVGGHIINDIKSTKSTPVYVLNPKQDLHGLGYDPYKHAPEFRENKRLRVSGNDEKGRRKPLSFQDSLFGFKSGRVAPGFGIGALEELDVEDEDVYAPGYEFEETYQIEDIEEPSKPSTGKVKMLDNKQHGILLGFKAASVADYQLERFSPPLIPKDFSPHHKFSAPLEIGYKISEAPPAEVPPPEDNSLKVLIEGVASLVARCGILFEDLSREKNRSDPLFAFLSGGNGHEFYKRKLWEERQKRNDKTKQQSDSKMSQSAQKMTAESRGRILGERPLERSSRDLIVPIPSADTANLQFNLSNTFTQPASQSQLPEVAKPFLHDPAKQERFEQFLKEKYHGGLRVTDAGEASKMSEAARARERLEFESVAEMIAKGNSGKESKPPSLLLADVLASSGLQFTASTIEKPKGTHDGVQPEPNMYPRREEYQWRPSPLLCKRFDLIDPFMGKPPPAPRPRTKMESFMFMPDSSKSAKVGESLNMGKDLLLTDQPSKERTMDPTEDIIEDAEVENVERPVDLYKAIFSDDSDEEVESTNPTSQVGDPEKKIEAANTTLSRLIAGDFLESLGKELGLEVPPDLPYSESKATAPNAQKQSTDAKGEREGLQLCGQSSNSAAVGGIYADNEMPSHDVKEGDKQRDSKLFSADVTIKKDGGESEKTKKDSKRVYQHGISSSSEDDSSRKRRRHRQRGRSSGIETSSSSDDYEDRHRSRSKKKHKESSRDGGSRSHSKHHRHHKHKHKRKESPSGSRHGSERERKERRDAKKDGHKYSARG